MPSCGHTPSGTETQQPSHCTLTFPKRAKRTMSFVDGPTDDVLLSQKKDAAGCYGSWRDRPWGLLTLWTLASPEPATSAPTGTPQGL